MIDATFLLSILSSCVMGLAVVFAIQCLIPIWDKVATFQLASLSGRFRRLGFDADQLTLSLRAWAIALVGGFFVLLFVLHAWPLACLWVALVYVAPRHVIAFLVRRRSRILRDQLVVACIGLSNAMRAGLALAQSLDSVRKEAPQPLHAQLHRITFEFDRGRPLKECISSVRKKLDLEAFTLFALALEVCIERGGLVNEALERISESLLENQRIERKLEAETAAGKQVVILLSLFPLGFLGLFYCLDPTATVLLFSQQLGQIVIATVALFVYCGTCWAARLLRIRI